ncbi:FK506-binding protein 2 [Emericellopsis atlantica]|uniref:peptidylprolyl isomerase n=1 Tax=Emericellopsis atlantica TaxID=2614577 RepID=A0A9P7ZQB0_9HYPO|nr:FK506-binding protein 2 [Emericellopsis atlantica]KAG9256136.1 FK506-binding protein 2 [Emericellopsis atlantica]
MKSTILFTLAATAAGLVSADELKIDKTHSVECERRTQNGDNIHMHYHGSLADSGKKFDASYDRGRPLTFVLGSGRVIKGWDQGLLDMCIGDKRTLTIPPELGYGQRAMGPIPAGSTLIFETELVGIDGVEPPETIEPEVLVEEVKTEAEGIAEKVASAAAEAADAAKTMVADTDDIEGHEEL